MNHNSLPDFLSSVVVGRGQIVISHFPSDQQFIIDFLSFSGDDEEIHTLCTEAMAPAFVVPMPSPTHRIFLCADPVNRNDAEFKVAECAMTVIRDYLHIEIEPVSHNGVRQQVFTDIKVELNFESLSQEPRESALSIQSQGESIFGMENFIFKYNAIVKTAG